jgi:hypothetical protein
MAGAKESTAETQGSPSGHAAGDAANARTIV